MCSSAPDPDPLIGQAAMNNVELSKEALQYYRDRDNQQAPRQAKLDALTDQVVQQQLASSRFNDTQARNQYARYQAEGIPAEDAMYADAAGYDSQAALDKVAGQAATDVDVAASAAQDAQRRQLARQGVNPADGRSLSLAQDAATQTALAKAGAMNQARDQRQQMGVMLRKDAASFARGMPGTAAQTFGTSMAAGGQATGAQSAAIGNANQTTGMMGNGFGVGMQGNNSAGSILGNLYGQQVQSANSSNSSTTNGLGSMATAAAMYFSDEAMKEDRAPVDGRAALAGIRGIQIQKWRYKPGTPADDGGQPHIGAMAQDLHQHLGEEVAPGGKMVDGISAIGTVMAAVQQIDKKVDALAKTQQADDKGEAQDHQRARMATRGTKR